MAQRYQYYPEAPGPQDPAKYGVRTGPNYAKWGEQRGFLYDPYTDTYKKDPRVEEERLRKEGLIKDPPKPPGLFETIAPVAGVLGAGALASEIGKNIGSNGIKKTVGGLLDLGSETTKATAETVANQGANAVTTGAAEQVGSQVANVGTQASTGTGASGLLGLGDAGASTVANPALSTPVPQGTYEALGATGGLPTLPALGVGAGVILGGLGAKDILEGKKRKGLLGLASRGTIGIATGGLSEVANSLLNGGKSKDQKSRDNFRSEIQGLGIADPNYQVTFSDGGSFDIGKDGKAKLANVGENIDGKTERHYYDVDFSNPLAVAAIPRVQRLIDSMYGDKLPSKAEQRVGLLVNAVTQGATDQATIDRRIAELEAKKGGTTSPVPTPTPTAPKVQTRSNTLSPGIGKDGKPISYGGRR